MTTNYTSSPLRVTITAGMDHDEYAGIEAARILGKKYRSQVNITVIPLDYSPIDGKLPKLVFPGNAHGTQTEQLMHWLYEAHIKKTDLWIDLHGGSTAEKLTPFIWIYQSKSEIIQKIYCNFITFTSAHIIVYDKKPFMNYSKYLDSKGIAYIMMECGDQGKRRKKDIAQLVRWTEEIIRPRLSRTSPKLYTSVRYTRLPITIPHGKLLWENTETNLHAYAMP